jgi:hypothetical protein
VTPEWAALLGDDYPEFRTALLMALGELGISVDMEHIDHGVLHTEEHGTMGLSNVIRLCHAAPREQWQAVIAEHLRRASAKSVDLSLDYAREHLRVRVTPEDMVHTQPESFVIRELADGLHTTLAIDLPEHVKFVAPKDLAAWGVAADELWPVALANTRAEAPLERDDIELDGGGKLTVLYGESYFAASHVLFLERYVEGEVLVAVPDRHAIACVAMDEHVLQGIGAIVLFAHMRFTEQPGAVSEQLYWRRGDQYVKVPCGVRDDGSPWVAPPDDFNEAVLALTRRSGAST